MTVTQVSEWRHNSSVQAAEAKGCETDRCWSEVSMKEQKWGTEIKRTECVTQEDWGQTWDLSIFIRWHLLSWRSGDSGSCEPHHCHFHLLPIMPFNRLAVRSCSGPWGAKRSSVGIWRMGRQYWGRIRACEPCSCQRLFKENFKTFNYLSSSSDSSERNIWQKLSVYFTYNWMLLQ